LSVKELTVFLFCSVDHVDYIKNLCDSKKIRFMLT